MCQTVYTDEDVLFKVPDGVSDKAAAVIEPLAVLVHAIHMSGFEALDTAVVVGAGPIGMLCGIMLKHAGASKIFISDVVEKRLEIAEELGFIPVNPAKENLEKVEENIQAACDRAGRKRDEVTLIAVSKTKPVEMLQEAYDLGVRINGENKAQELASKYEVLPKDIHWHMIGHMQRNKVKYIIDKVDLIHSVDSVRLAETIDKEAEKHGVIANILIEVNVAKEESKFGLMPEEVPEFVEKIAGFPHIRVKGLMTIAPFVENPEENRPIFAHLRKLSVDIAKKNIDNITMSILSMGMTNDYQVAIEEGATMVRVGTGIFGARDYTHQV